jgi:hypothetical protein
MHVLIKLKYVENLILNLVSEFNIRIENAPPRRGDAKGIVESCFRTLQAEFKPYFPGVVKGHRVKKHGERDYRLEAVVSIADFTEIILKTIIFRNNHHVMNKYDRSADMPVDLPSIPIDIWQWGIQNRSGGLRRADAEIFRIVLLPRQKVSLSPFGINMGGLYFTCIEIIRMGWLHRSPEIERPKNLEAAYDPCCADIIYLFPKENRKTYWTCSLTDRSRQFRGMTFWQVWDIQLQEKQKKADLTLEEDIKRRELDEFLKEKLSKAIKKAPSIYESNRERLSKIRKNKNDAIDIERKQRVKMNTIDPDKNIAKVVPLKSTEDDFSFPSFLSIFDEKNEE